MNFVEEFDRPIETAAISRSCPASVSRCPVVVKPNMGGCPYSNSNSSKIPVVKSSVSGCPVGTIPPLRQCAPLLIPTMRLEDPPSNMCGLQFETNESFDKASDEIMRICFRLSCKARKSQAFFGVCVSGHDSDPNFRCEFRFYRGSEAKFVVEVKRQGGDGMIMNNLFRAISVVLSSEMLYPEDQYCESNQAHDGFMSFENLIAA